MLPAANVDGVRRVPVGKGQLVAITHLAAIRHDDRLIDKGAVGRTVGAWEKAVLAGLFLDCLAGSRDIVPGSRRLVGIEVRLLEEVAIVKKDRRRERVGKAIGLAVDLAELQPLRDHTGELILQFLRIDHVFEGIGAEVTGDVDQVAEDQLRHVRLLAGNDIGLHARHDLVGWDGDGLDLDVGEFLFETSDQFLGRIGSGARRGEIVVVEADRHRLVDGCGHFGKCA